MALRSTPLLYTWRILRHIQRLKQRLFGTPTPHWVRDLLDLVAYLNILGLVPTLLCIALAPQHFFRRLPQYINGRNLYKTPIKFISLNIVLLSSGIGFAIKRGGLAQIQHVGPILLILSLVTPIWICGLCLVVAGVSAFLKAVVRGRPIEQFHDFSLDLSASLVPLDPSAYLRLRGARYLWGMLYFIWYAWAVSAVAILILGAVEVGIVSALGSVYWSEFRFIYAASGQLPFLLVVVGLTPALLIIRRALLVPYAHLLCAASNNPTRAMQRLALREVQDALRRRRHDRSSAHYLIARWQGIRFDMLCHQTTAEGVSAEATNQLFADWAEVYRGNDVIGDVDLIAGRLPAMSEESIRLEAVLSDLRALGRGGRLAESNKQI